VPSAYPEARKCGRCNSSRSACMRDSHRTVSFPRGRVFISYSMHGANVFSGPAGPRQICRCFGGCQRCRQRIQWRRQGGCVAGALLRRDGDGAGSGRRQHGVLHREARPVIAAPHANGSSSGAGTRRPAARRRRRGASGPSSRRPRGRPSALIHTEDAGIVARRSRMASAERVQLKGRGAWLCSAR
jgi:hypothetical protein